MAAEAASAGDAGDSIFQQIHDRDVRPWLDLVDELRAHGISQDLPLPQIAVMGDQSCGKSSVLEAISGIPFPRGSGLVTRCATQLIMKSSPKGSPWKASASIPEQQQQQHGASSLWRKTKSSTSKTSADFPKGPRSASTPEELTKVIEDLQDALTAGDQGAFSTATISVQVQAPGLPDLTLIDLPGIVRTATKGQRTSVMAEVNGLIQRFLEQERTIILAVVPANQDVAPVDILERAKMVDPEGDRTIGVLTKPDLIGPGNEDEAAAVLKNVRKPLKLGYVMVKCRSQRDIDQGMDNKESLSSEAAFFRQQPVFKSLPSSFFGVPNLTRRLTDLLVGRIKAALPNIKWEIQTQLVKADAELKPMLKGVPHTTAECHTTLMKIVSDYCRLLRQSARGYYRDDVLSAKPTLRLHAASQAIFRQLHQNIAATVPGFNDVGFGDRLGREIAALRGREMPGFLNHQVFYGFMIQNVETWRPAVESCRSQAANAALTVASLLVETLALQFPRLCSAVRDALASLVEQLAEEVSVRIDEIFQKESDPFTTNEGMLEVINTIRFRHFDKAVEDAMDEAGESPENMEALKGAVMEKLSEWYMRNHGVGTMANVEDMCTLLQAYWNVATKRLVDNVCMTMEQDFVVKLLGKVESELFLLTNRFSEVEELFVEDTSVVEKRRSLQAKKQRLLKGLETLMRMAPDLVATRPGGGAGTADDYVDSSQGLLQQASGRGTDGRDDPAQMKARLEEAALLAQAEGRSTSTDWSSTAWSRPAANAAAASGTSTSYGAGGLGGRQSSGGSSTTGAGGARQPDHYDLPVRPAQGGAAAGLGAPSRGPDPRRPVGGGGGGRGASDAASAAQRKQDVLVGRLVDMGFSRPQAEDALMKSGGDPDLAAEQLMTQGSDAAASNGRGGGGGGGSRGAPPVPPRARTNRGLPDNFSRQSGHPATSTSSGASRSTHFFGGGGGGGGGGAASVSATDFNSRNSQSPPQSASMRRGLEEGGGSNDDGGLADFLGSPAAGSSSVGGSGGARRVGEEADRYGLFPASTGGAAAGGGSRVAQSRSRYDALFGEEETKSNASTRRSDGTIRRRTDTSSLFGEDGTR
ncbi:Mx1, Mx-like dynamin-related GTPase [Ectocarpus siliculosus]|uniref:Mx1, Mx-like dynamin-related GTPase n=1 Tax=Ectocarpus siliculosus TaxID=2880 RepID=D7FR39_ECTSI|nr:Mx1, Mx-like dynamin-related GTPase [Ectocarpus siliculosus]|eukprot:CBJ26106.1 Mx1, Mx-like dynamin-related GTPase [Ectocarpus siliculosus]